RRGARQTRAPDDASVSTTLPAAIMKTQVERRRTSPMGGAAVMDEPKVSQVMADYLETIYNLAMEGEGVIGARLAEKFGVAPPTVTETLKRLVRDGLVEMDSRRHVTLTVRGLEEAERILRRHRLTERLLVDLLGMPWHQVHEEACRLEHQ